MRSSKLAWAAFMCCWLHLSGLAAADPKVTIDSWSYTGGDSLHLHVKLKAFAFPAEGHAVNVYLDDVLQWRETKKANLTLEGLLGGLHVVAVAAAENHLGHYLEFTTPDSSATVTVRVELPCSGPGDPSCDDGSPCSLDFCQKSGLEYTCEYGVMPGHSTCCDSNYECSSGSLCIGHACGPCSSDGDCGDGNSCTTDRCDSGRCVAEVVPGCCNIEGPCDDEDPCTIDDTCDGATCAGLPVECTDGLVCVDGPCISLEPDQGPGEGGSGCNATPGGGPADFLVLLLACLAALAAAHRGRAGP